MIGFGSDRILTDPTPEYASIEAFVENQIDEERATFTPGDVQKLAGRLRLTARDVAAQLTTYGLHSTMLGGRSVR